jgi:hypothetical protein
MLGLKKLIEYRRILHNVNNVQRNGLIIIRDFDY